MARSSNKDQASRKSTSSSFQQHTKEEQHQDSTTQAEQTANSGNNCKGTKHTSLEETAGPSQGEAKHQPTDIRGQHAEAAANHNNTKRRTPLRPNSTAPTKELPPKPNHTAMTQQRTPPTSSILGGGQQNQTTPQTADIRRRGKRNHQQTHKQATSNHDQPTQPTKPQNSSPPIPNTAAKPDSNKQMKTPQSPNRSTRPQQG